MRTVTRLEAGNAEFINALRDAYSTLNDFDLSSEEARRRSPPRDEHGARVGLGSATAAADHATDQDAAAGTSDASACAAALHRRGPPPRRVRCGHTTQHRQSGADQARYCIEVE